MAEEYGLASLQASTQAAAGVVNVATLTGVPGRKLVLTGFCVSAGLPSVNANGLVTITGLTTSPLSFEFTEATLSGGLLLLPSIQPGLPSATAGGSISVTLAAIVGGAASSVSLWGHIL